MARIRSDEADGTVEVFIVVPAGEGLHPSLSIGVGGKALGRPVWAVFAGAEQGLRERIVIADPRPAVGRGDAQFFHGRLHRRPFHPLPSSDFLANHERGAAVVGVQNQWARDAALGQDRLPDEDGCQIRPFALVL